MSGSVGSISQPWNTEKLKWCCTPYKPLVPVGYHHVCSVERAVAISQDLAWLAAGCDGFLGAGFCWSNFFRAESNLLASTEKFFEKVYCRRPSFLHGFAPIFERMRSTMQTLRGRIFALSTVQVPLLIGDLLRVHLIETSKTSISPTGRRFHVCLHVSHML
jgi:hypothetical protein